MDGRASALRAPAALAAALLLVVPGAASAIGAKEDVDARAEEDPRQDMLERSLEAEEAYRAREGARDYRYLPSSPSLRAAVQRRRARQLERELTPTGTEADDGAAAPSAAPDAAPAGSSGGGWWVFVLMTGAVAFVAGRGLRRLSYV